MFKIIKRIYLISLFATLLINGSCNEKPFSENIISEKGYIVYHDSSIWHFVIAKNIDNEVCLSGFNTNNLSKGYQFTPHSEEHIRIIESASHILKVENIGQGFSEKYYTLKIVPVKIELKVVYNKTKELVSKQPEYVTKVNGHFVKFDYDFVDIELIKLHPLDCIQ
ncbi:hypothetical protein [Pontibacter sp. H249]|uniref:hypothetical protein n=1 Tax=Pontibacter sp. H249 TaxID=3133420 RepID=UPI0030BDB169